MHGEAWSTPMNQTSGVGETAAIAVSFARLKPTVTMMLWSVSMKFWIGREAIVLRRVIRGDGHRELRRIPDGLGRPLDSALIRVFVEVLVIDFANVRRNADLYLRRVGREGSFVPGVLGSTGAWVWRC